MAWSAAVDTAVAAWLHDALGREPTGVAVVALGGYARTELCPASDVDLLLLHDGWPKPDLEALVQAVCYPLWDAGLAVGYAVRTPKEAAVAGTEAIHSATAVVDRRLVAGDHGLLDDLAARFRRWVARRPAALLTDLADADRARHEAAGERVGLLEPNLKGGVGGLRDIQSLTWAGHFALGEAGLDPLVSAGYLGPGERRALAAAAELLLQARCALHLVRGVTRPGSETDRLRADLVADVEARVGRPGLRRELNLASRTVAHLHGRAWQALLDDAARGRRWRRGIARPAGDGLVLDRAEVHIEPSWTADTDPSLPLRAVAAAAAAGGRLSRPAADRVERGVTGRTSPLAWDDRSRAALLVCLREADRAGAALLDADQLGVLAAYLPGWSRIRARPQHHPWHELDLDSHLLATVAELARCARDEEHADVWRTLSDPDALLLAGLLHDVGKAWPGDHSVTGGRIAHTWLLRMGFSAQRAERAATLVRHHLLLPTVATQRDLDDPEEIASVARAVEDHETLGGLYLLSLADGRATGPAVSSPWREQLLAALHARVREALPVPA